MTWTRLDELAEWVDELAATATMSDHGDRTAQLQSQQHA